MSEQMPHGRGGEDEPPRDHPQDPSEGPRDGEPNDVQAHSQDPAEGGDDDSATG